MRHSRGTTGFTLLEVLISVTVLAFGLLGVLAVFPAVIDVQRRAQDAVIGGSLAASAEATLSASVFESSSLNWTDWDTAYTGGISVPVADRFPTSGALVEDAYISSVGADPLASPTIELDYLWETDWSWRRRPYTGREASSLPGVLLDDGLLVIGGGESSDRIGLRGGRGGIPTPTSRRLFVALPEIKFDVGSRLLPDASSGAPPRYVWDAVVRRVDGGLGTPVGSTGNRLVAREDIERMPVEVAIFVRPVDRGIRVRAGLTLLDALRGYTIDPQSLARTDLEAKDRRYPVAVDEMDQARRQPGKAVNDASYSLPIAVQLSTGGVFTGGGGQSPAMTTLGLADLRFGTDLLPADAANARRALAQVGQLFVDNFGIVHRVTRVISDDTESSGPEAIEFSPAINPEAVQIVFTPQVPVDIRVIRTR